MLDRDYPCHVYAFLAAYMGNWVANDEISFKAHIYAFYCVHSELDVTQTSEVFGIFKILKKQHCINTLKKLSVKCSF